MKFNCIKQQILGEDIFIHIMLGEVYQKENSVRCRKKKKKKMRRYALKTNSDKKNFNEAPEVK